MQLLLILQELLLMQLSHRRRLDLQLLDALQYLDSVKTDLYPKVRLQILICDVIEKGAVDPQIAYIKMIHYH